MDQLKRAFLSYGKASLGALGLMAESLVDECIPTVYNRKTQPG